MLYPLKEAATMHHATSRYVNLPPNIPLAIKSCLALPLMILKTCDWKSKHKQLYSSTNTTTLCLSLSQRGREWMHHHGRLLKKKDWRNRTAMMVCTVPYCTHKRNTVPYMLCHTAFFHRWLPVWALPTYLEVQQHYTCGPHSRRRASETPEGCTSFLACPATSLVFFQHHTASMVVHCKELK